MTWACGAAAAAGGAPDGKLWAPVWRCPVCQGDGDWGGGSCLHCTGIGFVDEDGLAGWPEEDRVPGPWPPGVRARQCHDCAYRPGSQEQELGEELPGQGRPFWCHSGLPTTRGAYVPLLWVGSIPIGAKICAGWYRSQVLQQGRAVEGDQG